ncbi:TPA: hypothetical protein ACV98Q_000733 [Yersinia enterocolitica]|uniref:hypothetical protein n=1 Tax=Yersinia enterocolitica TaxID=630 RepID=UPI00290E63A4|nr:hypothetical protein [Yersinia enterocolitica]EKN6172266.1 hypothetical protein [Yersinia enterocolitica]HDL6896745.1 hypothetical protein [Yersinia enterocolitica]HDL7190930.1 hypothetical protein [Yersinia enterocolitica]HDL7364848.1 hypothetical protein [Yersinia enterocolitica]
MPQAIPKSVELTNELIDVLASDQTLSEMSFRRYVKLIERLNDFSSHDFLLALANAAYNRVDDALEYFRMAMQKSPNSVVAGNYLAFVNKSCSLFEVAALSAKFSSSYGFIDFYFTAYQSNLFIGQFEQASYFAKKFIKVSERKEAERMQHVIASAELRLDEFKKLANLTDAQYKLIAETAVHVMESHNQRVSALSFSTVKEENANAYILLVKCHDPEVISDMNMDLAFSLADHEELYDKNFSAWFQGSVGGKVDACN